MKKHEAKIIMAKPRDRKDSMKRRRWSSICLIVIVNECVFSSSPVYFSLHLQKQLFPKVLTGTVVRLSRKKAST